MQRLQLCLAHRFDVMGNSSNRAKLWEHIGDFSFRCEKLKFDASHYNIYRVNRSMNALDYFCWKDNIIEFLFIYNVSRLIFGLRG